jgi:hypothetical protein
MPAHPTKEWGVKPGMSKRFYAACAAMQGILSGMTSTTNPEELNYYGIVNESYELADELLKQENENTCSV